MERKNSQGQILIEVAVVMFFLMIFVMIALSQVTQFKNKQHKHQFQKGSYEKNLRS